MSMCLINRTAVRTRALGLTFGVASALLLGIPGAYAQSATDLIRSLAPIEGMKGPPPEDGGGKGGDKEKPPIDKPPPGRDFRGGDRGGDPRIGDRGGDPRGPGGPRGGLRGGGRDPGGFGARGPGGPRGG